MQPTDPGLVELAAQLVSRAGELTLGYFRSNDLLIDTKADGSPVTAADRAAEAFLRDELTRRFPDDAVVGEEFGTTAGASGRTWFIDPIDGTKAFTKGVPLFTNLLAMVDDHGPAIGAVNAPAAGELIAAGRGLGAHHNSSRCHVSEITDLADATATTSGYDYWPDHHVAKLKSSGARMVTWGDGYGYILVATGRAEAMIDPGLNPWDVAPMNVVIPESGGRITDFAGTSRPKEGDVVATNGLVHEQVLALLD
jgi:histidinol-phosphatase